MRWTRQRLAQGGCFESVSNQQHADERCCSVRRSRVVLTPRRWRQVCGVASAQPGLDKTYPLMTEAKQPGHGGEHDISRQNHCVRECRAIPVYSYTRVRSTTTKCTRGRGCSGHPAFPTPSKGAEDFCKARAHGAVRS